jgi:sugar (pentulose or hexulose) kinase
MANDFFLGLDLSTQSLTAVVIEPATGDLHRHAMHFDSCYPSYQTTDGVIIGDDPRVVHVDPRMWIEALDDMLDWLNQKGLSRKIGGIVVTAGGSENRGLLKIISRVFGTEVCSFEIKESAALGAAIRAAHCCLNNTGSKVSWNELTAPYLTQTAEDVITPSPAEVEIYHHKNGLLRVYEACENFAFGTRELPQAEIEAFKQQFPN